MLSSQRHGVILGEYPAEAQRQSLRSSHPSAIPFSMAGKFKWVGLSEDGETVTLRKFHGTFKVENQEMDRAGELTERSKIGLVLDVETTGLSRADDKVIEIGLRMFRFDPKSGRLLQLLETYSALEDPMVPLSAEIQQLTGLTDQDLKGKVIDWNHVDSLLQKADLIIAHNASFDRPFLDRYTRSSSNRLWGCSLKQVDWQKKGFSVQKLELLCMFHGFFTDAHRAQNDVDALVHLLSTWDNESKRTYLAEVYENAQRPWTRVFAFKAPFESKDDLRRRGYRWEPNQRVWIRTLFPDALPEEKEWLENQVYHGPFAGKILDIPINDHFK
jgi:DNA polymerase-3 subunit epsilon